MASFNQTGRSYAGSKNTITVNGGASPVNLDDTLTLHGIKLSIREWIRRGVLRTVTTSVNTVTYKIEHEPESA